jgi:hypothetical protein
MQTLTGHLSRRCRSFRTSAILAVVVAAAFLSTSAAQSAKAALTPSKPHPTRPYLLNPAALTSRSHTNRGHYLPRVQRLIAMAKVPVVSGTRVVMGPGPVYGGKFSYYDPEHDTIYWIPDYSGRRNPSDLYHELGHAFDRKVLSDEDRGRLKRMFGGGPRDWFWGDRTPIEDSALPDPYEETFADAYSRAARGLRKERKLQGFLRSVARDRGGV